MFIAMLRLLLQMMITGIVVYASSWAWAAAVVVKSGMDLQKAIHSAHNNDTLIIETGIFSAEPHQFIDSLCGNCLDPNTPVNASYGFIIEDKSLVVLGRSRTETKLVTNAGYGVFIRNSPSVALANLTITGGKRDPDGNATDAALVVRNAKIRVQYVDIRDNDHRVDTVVVGIGGIFGREGAELDIGNCTIENNSWDGVALYRGAIATVTDCLIKDGRGAGIGVTWDAACTAYRNEITGYWKGIGAFGTTWVVARNNIVHDNLGWGMIATGQAYMDMTNNVVFHNGNCGIAPWSTETKGRIVNNIIAENGWRDEWVCPCVGVWNYGDWSQWKFSNNIVFHNKAGNYEDIWDQTGVNGNMDTDPLFVGNGDFHLQKQSPGIHGGDSTIFNHDGSISHIGVYGGPQAPR